MNAVIEIDIVRQVVHANPLDGFSGLETRAHRLQIRTVGPELFVTIHAHGSRGNTSGRGGLDRRVAIAAIDAVIAYVMFVAELDRLLAFDPLAGIPGERLISRPPRGRLTE